MRVRFSPSMNLAHLLLQSARRLPERPALAAGRQAVRSYRDLAARVCGISFSLKSRFKLAQGERVALAMKNCPQYYEVLFGCWHAGLAAVPMNAKLHAREFAYILENAGARLCVVSPELQAAIPRGILASELESDEEAVPAEVRPDDAAADFYYAAALNLTGDLASARDALEGSLQLQPNASNHYFLAACLIGLNNYDEALAELEVAAKLEPQQNLYRARKQELLKLMRVSSPR